MGSGGGLVSNRRLQEYRADNEYFMIRECVGAAAMTCRLAGEKLAELGGEDVVTAGDAHLDRRDDEQGRLAANAELPQRPAQGGDAEEADADDRSGVVAEDVEGCPGLVHMNSYLLAG
jgi:hypothetical protein